ncbi:MAG: type IV secretory system conjugative DNA transfer family protein [Oscillospiraceae bacterium]|jgi:type IV secretion system protein VirD4|nr:type IV secretory system conjugative DNA transfer family protein [Oscillospiraceae bacterium]
MKLSRRIGIALAVLLGLAALLYLGGLAGQFMAGYAGWLAGGGMGGGAVMPAIRAGPLDCLRVAFSLDGLKGMALVLLLTGGIFAYVKLHNKFKPKDLDDRNFTRSKNGTYGTAGWMGEKEMKSVLEVSAPAKAAGVILGQKNGAVVCLPEDTRLNRHIAVFGASGTMKSRGFVRPYLFQAIKRGESVIITDPKSELYSDTAELFRKNGYCVKVFNLVSPRFGDSWNCMADLGGDTLMAQILTDVIISNTGGEKADHFWDNGEGNLLKALVLYIDQDSSREPGEKNLPAVYQLLTQCSEKQLTTLFDRLPLGHPAKAPYNLFAQSSDNVRAGIILGLGTRLQVLQNEAVRKITGHSDIDLTLPGRQKCAYYVILSDQEGSLEFLSSLFFSFLFIQLVRYADGTAEGRCKIPVTMCLDEFNNVGVIPDIARKLSTIRSRSINVCMIVQNLSQLKNRYPHDLWAELLGNADTHLMLGCTDEPTAEFISARSGDMTVDVNSTQTVRQTLAVAQVIPQYRKTEGLGRRRLMTTDEVLRLPNDELLIIIRGQKILKANKFDYTGHPLAKEMTRSPIGDYQPTRCAPPEPPKKDPPAARPTLYSSAQPPEGF